MIDKNIKAIYIDMLKYQCQLVTWNIFGKKQYHVRRNGPYPFNSIYNIDGCEPGHMLYLRYGIFKEIKYDGFI